MQGGVQAPVQTTSGHVFRVERKRGSAWYAKYRLPDGRQVQRKIGPAWSQRGRPAAGYYTKRLAEDWLSDVFEQARRGTLPGMVQTGATFADAAAEFLRYVEHDRALKPSTLRGYRSIDAYLLPAFGSKALADAALRPLRFHDLRHTFGTRMIAKADIRRLREWMGHDDIQTTMRYLHYAPRAEDAAMVAEAFCVQDAHRPTSRRA
jgi:hypothetical protein